MTDHRLVTETADRLARVQDKIHQACARAGRTSEQVRLVAVSKKQSLAAIRAAYAAGQRDFGENYVQELASRATALADLSEIRWRLIGHLQRNKAKHIVNIGCAMDTIDSPRIAETLNRLAREAGLTIEVMIQVNLGDEAQKSGCAVDQIRGLVDKVKAMEALDLTGLMTIPPWDNEPEQSRPWFRKLYRLAEELSLKEISMGMSADMEVAIEEGATMVRVGTAIFGPRMAG